MTGRRSHRKSRAGCLQCKARKVKCDENKPNCGNCIKHGVDCTYPAYQPKNKINRGSSVQHLIPSSIDSIDEDDSSMNMLDLELLHHFSTSTAYTVSQSPLLQNLWRIDIPQVAFSARFVMRSLLAFSALHLAYCKPGKREFYINKALQYHETALQTANKILLKANEENCTHVFLLAVLTCFMSCAKPRQPNDFLLLKEQGLSDWLILFRGARSIVDMHGDHLKSGPLASMFELGIMRISVRETAPIVLQQPLVDLRRFIAETVTNVDILRVYDKAIEALSKAFTLVWNSAKSNSESAEIFLWLFESPEEYLNLLGQRIPEAMVIFAFYCVLLRQLEWAWWMQGWSMHLIAGIYHALDLHHRGWIRWPMEQIGWVPA